MNPTVGRIVHFYSSRLRWHRERRGATWSGPFAATVVAVNHDGTVNLNVMYPSAIHADDRGTWTCLGEIVEEVSSTPAASGEPRWEWPPREAPTPNRRTSNRLGRRSTRR